MILKMLLSAAAMTLLVSGVAHAGDFGGVPPYESAAYGYAGYDMGCGGFTLAGVRAGVTVLGVNLGAGVRASIGGGCGRHIGGGVAVAPTPVYQAPAYPGQGYPQQGFAQPAAYGPAYPQPAYGYAPQPCSCQTAGYGYPQPY